MKIAQYLVIVANALVLSFSTLAQDVSHSTNEGKLVAANAELVTRSTLRRQKRRT